MLGHWAWGIGHGERVFEVDERVSEVDERVFEVDE